jgi:GNAT superfamily N-acetyltransferase
MGVRIRRGEATDARAIARVQVESWRSTYEGVVPGEFLATMDVEFRAERWMELITAGAMQTFVAEDGKGVLGFVSGGKPREPFDGYDAELFAIYLLRESQGKGVGRNLFQLLARTLQAADHTAMALWVLSRNPAVKFYQRMGGVEIARKMIEIGGAPLEEIAFGFELSADALQGDALNKKA